MAIAYVRSYLCGTLQSALGIQLLLSCSLQAPCEAIASSHQALEDMEAKMLPAEVPEDKQGSKLPPQALDIPVCA